MPTIQVQFTKVKRRRGTNNVRFFATDSANRQIEREVDETLFDTWEDVAEWLIQQNVEWELLPEKERTIEVTFHTEVVTDPESGEDSTVRVLDGVTVLP